MDDDSGDRWRAIISEPLNLRPFEPVSAAIRLDVSAQSVGGKSRLHNTDHYLVLQLRREMGALLTSLSDLDLPPPFSENAYALLVADGLGDETGGARASRLALSALAHLAVQYGQWNVRIAAHTSSLIAEQGDFFYRRMNEIVVQAGRAHAELGDMATSLTTLYVVEDDLFFSHIGHSRAYLFRDGVLIQLTATHTLDGLNAGRPVPIERAKRDSGHVITAALGTHPTLASLEVEQIKLLPGDRLLLCTNGLTDAVGEDEMASALAARRRPVEECRWLTDRAVAAGSQDDVTVIVADYLVRPHPP
jgi:protein phosphatase